MPSITVAKNLVRELIATRTATRVTEPDLIMDDPDKVAAYTDAGRVDGVMAPVYLFHCAQISSVIRPGDRVIDLGCGSATQLGLVAQVNSGCDFIGIDLSNEMLDKARTYIDDMGLSNVSFQHGDITQLKSIEDQSVDAVMSTVVLHHLPDTDALDRVFSEIKRVLKPGGGIYIVDFGHLKSENSIHDFAYQYADRQAELFTLDYLYSLQAAFWKEDFQHVQQKHLADEASLYSTFLVPFMVAVKSQPRREPTKEILDKLALLVNEMPNYHKTDLKDLRNFFGFGGLKSPFLG
jgi:ubiquinone/menaquinone biosynthesis C-methylase UbiE